MNKFFLLFLLITGIGTAQWEIKNNGLPDSDDWITAWSIDADDEFNAIISISFNTTGYLPATLFRTTDGGNNWFQLPAPSGLVVDVEILGNKIWGATDWGSLIFSSDGGQTWTVQFSDSSKTEFMNYIEMFDELNGVAMGDVYANSPTYNPGPALFLKTTDGGLNWVSVNDSAFGGVSGDTWRRLDFVSPSLGYFRESGINPGRIYKTVDGCNSWQQLPLNTSSVVIKFYDENLGITSNFVSSGNYSVSRTLNGGESWETFAAPLVWGNDIEFEAGNPANVWTCDKNNLFFSNDTGKTWSIINTPQTELKGRDMIFTGQSNMWLLCDGAVLRNTNVHSVLSMGRSVYSPQEFRLEQNYPNPFNPSTTINFSLEKEGFSTLKIYNSLGELLWVIAEGVMEAGYHQINFDGRKLNSGVYFYTLTSGSQSITKKMLLLK